MPTRLITYPVLPGKTDALRAFVKELSGPRKKEWAASRGKLGMTLGRAYLQHTPEGDRVNLYTEGEHVDQLMHQIATADTPFDNWFREQFGAITGVDFSKRSPAVMLFNGQRVKVSTRS